jgi:hypothetical protein
MPVRHLTDTEKRRPARSGSRVNLTIELWQESVLSHGKFCFRETNLRTHQRGNVFRALFFKNKKKSKIDFMLLMQNY